MIAYQMIYAMSVGVPVALAAALVAWLVRRSGWAERGVWLVALCVALALPLAPLLPTAPTVDRASGPPAPEVMEASGSMVEKGVLGLPTVVLIEAPPEGRFDTALLVAWLLVSFGLALRWWVAVRRLARAAGSWRPSTLDGVQVWLTPDLGPAVSGLARPRILVPQWLTSLPSAQQSLVLLHETEHVRARDPVLLTLARATRVIAPWNPVVWLLTSRLMHAIELDCDRRVLRRHPDVGAYGDTLLTVSARDVEPHLAVAAFAETDVPLQKRITAMTTPPRTASVLGAAAVLAAGSLLVLTSCKIPVPKLFEADASADVPSIDSKHVFTVTVGGDGSVDLDGEPHQVENVSEVVGPLFAASDRALIVRIRGDRSVPYGVMQRLQDELVEAGVRRVVFDTLYTRADPVQPLNGLRMVLPEVGQSLSEISVSQQNILHIVIRPDGLVDVRRGGNPEVQQMRAEHLEDLWIMEVAENPNLIAGVKAHPEGAYEHTTAVLTALQAAGAQRISLEMLRS